MSDPDSAVLLYDGSCGFCSASVQFVLKHDRKATLRFASLQGEFGRGVVERHPTLATVNSVVWCDEAHDEIKTQSAAAVRVCRYLGGAWQLLAVAAVLPAWMRDPLYGLVANHRHRLILSSQKCLVPPPEQSQRFLA